MKNPGGKQPGAKRKQPAGAPEGHKYTVARQAHEAQYAASGKRSGKGKAGERDAGTCGCPVDGQSLAATSGPANTCLPGIKPIDTGARMLNSLSDTRMCAPAQDIATACLEQISGRIPGVLDRIIKHARQPLGEYSSAIRGTPQTSVTPLQDGEDLIREAEHETLRVLSSSHAIALRRTLENEFCVLTANHYGADFHPEFVQGNLVFGLHAILGGAVAVPVFACGCVPKHNVGYPRGMLYGLDAPSSLKSARIPVLPDKHRRAATSHMPAFTADDVYRAEHGDAVKRLAGPLRTAASYYLQHVFGDSDILSRRHYNDQAPLMNERIWRLLFSPSLCPPPLIHINMATLSGALLCQDFSNPYSLASMLLEPNACRALFTALNGARGCWYLGDDGLFQGSFLFWDVRDPCTMKALRPDASFSRLYTAEGDSGFPLRASALQEALRAGSILPGLFMHYAPTALARGLLCCGGVYQRSYLSVMRLGAAEALRSTGSADAACHIDAAPESPLGTGFLPLRCINDLPPAGTIPPGGAQDTAPTRLLPGSFAAGPLEIFASGGLNERLIGQLAALSTESAFLPALAYHYEDLIPADERLQGWLRVLEDQGGVYLPTAVQNHLNALPRFMTVEGA